MQHRPIAHAIPAFRVRGVENCLHFLWSQVSDEPCDRLFGRDCQDASNLVGSRRLTKLKEVHEGLDGREAYVSRAGAVASRGLEVIEEAEHQGRIELIHV